MVEEVKIEESEPSNNLKAEKKQVTLLFYILNLNCYLIPFLVIESIMIKSILFILINTFVFRRMFGFDRYKRIMFWHVIIILTYIFLFDGFRWEYILFIITSIINVGYYVIVIKNGRVYFEIGKES